MDLIYTDSKRVDQGVLSAYAFDLSYGASENDFAMVIGMAEAMLDYGAFIYMDDCTQFALIGIQYAIAYKALPCRQQFVIVAEV